MKDYVHCVHHLAQHAKVQQLVKAVFKQLMKHFFYKMVAVKKTVLLNIMVIKLNVSLVQLNNVKVALNKDARNVQINI